MLMLLVDDALIPSHSQQHKDTDFIGIAFAHSLTSN